MNRREQNSLLVFRKSIVDDISAAFVGISAVDWLAIQVDQASEERAAMIMKKNRFDVLPIVSGAEVEEFFHTLRWNDYSTISRSKITEDDVIAATTHIRDVIRNLYEHSRLYYFLSNNEQVVGLVSVANLNSRPVKLYLFTMLSEIEVKLGRFISRHVSKQELLSLTLSSGGADREDSKYYEPRKRFDADQKAGIDLEIVEYLYLSDLIRIAISKSLHSLLGYSKSEFEKELNSINDLRHSVAHPGRSIITRPNSVSQLCRRIDRMENAIARLRVFEANLEVEN